VPEQTFPIAPLSRCDPCGLGWPETGFRESFRKRRLSPAEEIGNACENDDHEASPGTMVRYGRPAVRGADNIPDDVSFKVLMPFISASTKFSSIKPVTYRRVLAG
jgi:hypothetical protein